jgi:N-acetylglucosamine-6-phosphate deacetylase
MKNYSKVVEKMKSKQLSLKQLKLSLEDINYLRDIGYNVKEQYDPRVEDYVYYIVTSGDTAYIKISDSLKKGQEVIIEDDVAKLCDRTAFAGSIATGDRLIRTMINVAGCSLPDAIKMATQTPARIMGASTKGKLAKGFDADIIIFDNNINIQKTIINGKTIYSK